MAPQACEEFTAGSWWSLVEWLSGQLHRRLAKLRRGRRELEGARPFLFHGQAQQLECIGRPCYHPRERPHAWVTVDMRRSDPVRSGERKITLEVRLPEAHARKLVQDTAWWCAPKEVPLPGATDEETHVPHDREWRRVRIEPRRLQNQLRAYEQQRLRDSVWRPPLTPPRVWIEPGRTPLEVTKMALLLILWQEGLVKFGLEESPGAWTWAKAWTRSRDDARCLELMTRLRQRYVMPEDWRGLRICLGMACRELRAPRGDALNYARPFRDELDESMTAEVS